MHPLTTEMSDQSKEGKPLSVRARVKELPKLPEGFGPALKLFHLTHQEFCMLSACDRDDVSKFGCDLSSTSGEQKSAIYHLREMGHVEFRVETGKYELKPLGRSILKALPLWACDSESEPGVGKLIAFPESTKEKIQLLTGMAKNG